MLNLGRPKIQSTLQPRIPPCCHDLEFRLDVQPIPHQLTDVTPCHATTKGNQTNIWTVTMRETACTQHLPFTPHGPWDQARFPEPTLSCASVRDQWNTACCSTFLSSKRCEALRIKDHATIHFGQTTVLCARTLCNELKKQSPRSSTTPRGSPRAASHFHPICAPWP